MRPSICFSCIFAFILFCSVFAFLIFPSWHSPLISVFGWRSVRRSRISAYPADLRTLSFIGTVVTGVNAHIVVLRAFVWLSLRSRSSLVNRSASSALLGLILFRFDKGRWSGSGKAIYPCRPWWRRTALVRHDWISILYLLHLVSCESVLLSDLVVDCWFPQRLYRTVQ